MAIWIELNGGLGNQLFQYAFAKTLQSQSKYKVYLTSEKKYSVNSRRKLELNKFQISLKIKDHTNTFDFFDRLICRLKLSSIARKECREKKKNPYQEIIIDNHKEAIDMHLIKNQSYLIGFYQKFSYLANIKKTLLKEFRLNLPLSQENAQMLDAIKKTKSVSLHIRRGDFLSHSGVVVLEKDYFEKALARMEKEIGEDFIVYVFSEDLDWARENIKPKQETIFVNINDDKNVVFDLELMKNCKHNILSNSTLAWWAGFLNTNKYKVVIAPQKYMHENGYYNKDIHDPSWIQIED